MENTKPSKELLPRELPRRLRLSAREIGVAIALTLAAAAQIWASFGGRDDRMMPRSEQANGGKAAVEGIAAR